MEQVSFLSKLYEIKPYKVVDSPPSFKSGPGAPPSLPSKSIQKLQQGGGDPQPAHPDSTVCNNLILRPISNNVERRGKDEASPGLPGNIRKFSGCVGSPSTPSKQNAAQGAMIDSHLYTSLSSSIDTLFSKIEKIKQQFELQGSHRKSTHSAKAKGCQGRLTPTDQKQLSQYSPIDQGRIKENLVEPSQHSSLNSLRPLITNINQAVLNNLGKRTRALNQKQADDAEPFSSIRNIEEMSNKTKSIIDQINVLLESSKKYNNDLGARPKAEDGRNLFKGNYLDSEQLSDPSDDLDSSFLPIKLKSTQSEYLPELTQHPNPQLKKQGSCHAYKIERPLYHYVIKQQISSFEVEPPRGLNQHLTMRDLELGKCVGSGKFGDVHICKHKATGFIFALKKIFKSTIREYNMVDQFILELKIHYLASSSHPNITKLYTHFEDEYHIFLLMEYMTDGNLMARLRQPEHLVSQAVGQVLDAVEHLHRLKIAHRDLKPENILLSYGVVKICDFGWSSLFHDQMRKTFCGTLDYVSPEMKDRGEYSTSVDLWSIGVLTFELLAGVAPYKNEIQKWKTMGGRIRDKWRWDVQFPPEIPPCAREFISGLLRENPDDRLSIRECRAQEFISKYNSTGGSGLEEAAALLD